jgi:hypothetical protein
MLTTIAIANFPFPSVNNHHSKKLLEVACQGINMPNLQRLQKLLDI